MTAAVLTVAVPEHEAERVESSAVVARARVVAAAVVDEATKVAAEEFVIAAKAAEKAIIERFEPAAKAAHAAHRSITALRESLATPFADAARIAKTAACAWQDAEARRRAEAARAAEAAARKAAEDAKLDEAAEAEAAGHDDAAAFILSEPVVVPAVAAPAPVAKAAGIVYRTRYEAVVVDRGAFLRAALDRPDLAAFVTIDIGALARRVAASKGAESIPGVECRVSRT